MQLILLLGNISINYYHQYNYFKIVTRMHESFCFLFFKMTKSDVYIGIKSHCKVSWSVIHNIFKQSFLSGTNIHFYYHKKNGTFMSVTNIVLVCFSRLYIQKFTRRKLKSSFFFCCCCWGVPLKNIENMECLFIHINIF